MHLELGPRIIIRFSNGLFITETVCWAVIVAIALIIFAVIATRNLKEQPKGFQVLLEFLIEFIYKFVKDTMGKQNVVFAPFIGTLFLYLLFCNALGLLGPRATTSDLNFTFAMSITVFFIIQFNSVKSRGIKGYFKHYAEPFAFMIPINIMEEVVFPVSLSFRIFGNILAGVIVVELWMNMMATASKAILRPIPLLDNIPILQAVSPLPVQAFFDIFEPVLQAFVFSMLTMVFIAKAIVVHNREE